MNLIDYTLADIEMRQVSELGVKEAEDGDMVESGKALLAPGDAYMILKPTAHLTKPNWIQANWSIATGLLSMSSFDRLPPSRVLPQSE